MNVNADVKCAPEALRTLLRRLSKARSEIADALETLKAEYESLAWDDRLALITERILNEHINAMNTELTRLGTMIHTIELMLEETDYYTSSAATAVSR
jgi:uncharacterized protein YukE